MGDLGATKPPTAEKGLTMTIDAAINRIGKSPTVTMVLVATLAMSCSFVGTLYAYIVEFTGFIPEEMEQFSCVSQKCLDLKSKFVLDTGEVNKTLYEVATICDSGMERDIDYNKYTWDLSRTTFAIDFNLICKGSSISLLKSLYFVGGTISLLLSTVLFESLGRRKTAFVAGAIGSVATFVGMFSPNYEMMAIIRLLQGFGNFTAYGGCYIWVLEFVPEKYRVYYNTWSMLIWCIGYPLLVFISYITYTWRNIFLVVSIVTIVTYIPLLILPDSPRFLMSIGRVGEAKTVLKKYANLANISLELDGVTLVVGENATKTESVSILTRLKEIWNNGALFLETILQWYLWFTCCLLFYFLNYGWSSFGDTPYINYLFAGLGEAIAYVILVPEINIFGRRKGMVFCLGASCTCFLLAMIPWTWSEVWSFERLMNLVAIVFVSDGFALAFLYTNELAPTTHRGFALSSSSVIARFAAFLGPFVTDIFGNHNTLKLAITAFLAGAGALLSLLLPETKKMPIPEQPRDVTIRRKEQNLVNPCCNVREDA